MQRTRGGSGTDQTAAIAALQAQANANDTSDLGLAAQVVAAQQTTAAVATSLDVLATTLAASGRLFIQQTEPVGAVAPAVWIRTDSAGTAKEMLIKRPGG